MYLKDEMALLAVIYNIMIITHTISYYITHSNYYYYYITTIVYNNKYDDDDCRRN